MTTKLMSAVLVSSLGMGYFVYGKRQGRIIALLSGLALCTYPYFVSNPYLFIGVAVLFLVLPFIIRY